MYRKLLGALLGATAFLSCICSADPASAQWRTHYVRRDGLFHVERLHTGNGLTPVGGAVLTTGITAFAPIVGEIATGKRDEPSSRERSEREASAYEAYRQEIASARALLQRTASLVDSSIPVTNGVGGGGGGDEGPAPNSDFGSDPWKKRPGASAAAGAPQGAAPAGAKSTWAPRP